jgi:hypothetical protein
MEEEAKQWRLLGLFLHAITLGEGPPYCIWIDEP